MNQLLAPGETMIYRAKPAWRAVALLIGAGLGVALVFHVIVGLWDDNWRCPASLMVLGFTALLGIALSSAASKTEAIVTDQRVYYRGADDQLVVIRRSDITDVELLEDEVPIAAVRICDRHGLETTAKLLAAPRSFHSVLLGEAEIPAREPETLRGAVFVLTAFTCAAFVALNAVTAFGVFVIVPFSELFVKPLCTMFGDPGDLSYRITSIAIIVPLALACNGPVLGFGALGAFLGYLPFLALSRLLICFEEAKQMALVIRRRVAGLPEAKPKNFYSRYLSLWTRPQAQLCAWIAEGLVSWLYRRPINLPEQTQPSRGDFQVEKSRRVAPGARPPTTMTSDADMAEEIGKAGALRPSSAAPCCRAARRRAPLLPARQPPGRR